MLFDAHAHYDDEAFNNDRDEVIRKVHENGVAYILNASSNIASAVESISLAQKFDFVYAAVGIHPHDVQGINMNAISTIGDMASHKKVRAVGEIGLDYHYQDTPRELQKLWFKAQINLAKNLGLPVIIHSRESHEDVLEIVKNENAKTVGGVFHCFSGSVEVAREALNNNFYISFGGPVTFKNARRPMEAVMYVPLDRLLIETDCPMLAPEPHRGRRNDSSYLRLIAEKIADIKGLSYEEVSEVTTNNAMRLFGVS